MRVTATDLTPEEKAIYKRVKGETDDWKTITEDSVDDYSLMEDPFKLPDKVKVYQNKRQFAFRWIERTSARLDEVRSATVPNRWWIVNKETFPQLDGLFDPILGCITRMDQMLVFKPYWMHEKRKKIVQDLTDAQDRSGTLEGLDGTVRDGIIISGGKRDADNPETLRQEIKAGDKIEYEEPLNTRSEDSAELADLT
jgi:hypothetical protein